MLTKLNCSTMIMICKVIQTRMEMNRTKRVGKMNLALEVTSGKMMKVVSRVAKMTMNRVHLD